MANLKISQLPEYSGNTSGSYLVMNNSGETITYKVKKENYIFPYNGNATITGSLTVSGSVVSTSNARFNTISIGKGGQNTSSTNTAVGNDALNVGNGAVDNTAIGNVALFFYNETSSLSGNNTAIGSSVLSNHKTGSNNTGIGAFALEGSASGSNNIGIGVSSLASNVSGSNNIAIGNTSMYSNKSSNNIAIGPGALYGNSTGSYNIAIGNDAGRSDGSSNNFYLSNYNEFLTANSQRSGSLMWGKFSPTASLQTLQINASTDIRNNLNITGSLTVSGSANTDVTVIGRVNVRNVSETGRVTIYGDQNYPNIVLVTGSFATTIEARTITMDNNADRIELTTNGVTGSKTQIRTVDPSFNTQTIIELPCSSSWNNGLTKFKYPVEITGSVNITSVMTLSQQSPLPTGTVGSLAVSGSNLFYHNGSSWSQIN
jgi:hypothetical protein